MTVKSCLSAPCTGRCCEQGWEHSDNHNCRQDGDAGLQVAPTPQASFDTCSRSQSRQSEAIIDMNKDITLQISNTHFTRDLGDVSSDSCVVCYGVIKSITSNNILTNYFLWKLDSIDCVKYIYVSTLSVEFNIKAIHELKNDIQYVYIYIRHRWSEEYYHTGKSTQSFSFNR